MKTVLVIYTDEKLTHDEALTLKRYAFVTDSDLSVGDHIQTDLYETPLQVVEILDTLYTHTILGTGELLETKKPNTNCVQLRQLVSKKPTTSSIVTYTKL